MGFYDEIGQTFGLEAQLLLLCARTQPTDEAAFRIQEIAPKNLNWESLFRLAARNRTAPLLYINLTKFVPDRVPYELRTRLVEVVQKGNARNVLLKNELVRVLRLLQNNGIPAIPYKGPLLSEMVYGNFAIRQFGDLDLLVQPANILKTKNLLLENGYRPKWQLMKLTSKQEQALLKSQYTYDFDRDDGRVRLEVHWRITPVSFSCPLNMEAIWQHTSETTVNGFPVLTLSPEDLLLILCVSGAKHVWERLQRICDVAQLLHVYPGLDWERVIRNTVEARAQRILRLGLLLADHLLDAPLPAEIRQEIDRDALVQKLAKKITKKLFTERIEQNSMLEDDGQFQPIHIQMRENFRDRLFYCWLLAVTPNVGEWLWMQIPERFYFLYYLVRPARLATKYGSRAFRRWFRPSTVA